MYKIYEKLSTNSRQIKLNEEIHLEAQINLCLLS